MRRIQILCRLSQPKYVEESENTKRGREMTEGDIEELVVDPLTDRWAVSLEKLCGGNCSRCKHQKRCQFIWDKITAGQTERYRRVMYKRYWPQLKALVGAK